MKHARVLALAFVASLAHGCAGSTPTLTSPDLAVVQGAWNLVSIQPIGEGEQLKPSGATYTVVFADGRLTTRADCNSCAGSYALDGQTFMVGPSLACTRAACATMAFENAYTRLLGGESMVSLASGTLVLSSPRGVLRFVR